MIKTEGVQKPRVKISVSDSESSEEESLGSDREDVSNEEDSATGAETVESNDREQGSQPLDSPSDDDDDESEPPGSDDEDMESAGGVPAGSDEEDTDPENEGSDSDNNEDNLLMVNEGWADSVAKILGSKKPKNKKTLVLSRAKKHSEVVAAVKEEKPSFEVLGEAKEAKPIVKKESAIEEPPAKKKKIDKASIRVRPNVLEKDREKILSKIATKGVVQLFNVVRNQQKTLEKQTDRSDLSEVKKEKILKKFDKRTFLDTLMGQTKSVVVDQEAKSKSLKKEVKNEETPKWSALRDDFMTGAKLKDWDKESGEDE